MMSNASIRSASTAGALALAIGLAVTPAAAQTPTLTFVGETGGDDVSLLLGSASFSGDGLGLKPVFGLTTYLLAVDGATDTETDYTIEPWVGLRSQFNGGFVQGKVGYAWKSADNEDEGTLGVPFYGGSESGVVVGGHLEYWGTGSFGAQGIASYNTASSYLWTRGRGTVPVAPWSGGTLNLGGELGWQGDMDDDVELLNGVEVEVETYEALQFGPVLQWTSDRLVGTLGGGWKKLDDSFGGDTWYFKFEMTLIPG